MTGRTATVALLAVALAGCGATARPDPPAPQRPADVVLLIDADEYGAIVLSGRDRQYRGIGRDGTVHWRAPVDPRGPDPVSCLARCPDAVLAGSADSANSLDVADPQSQLILGGTRLAVGPAEGLKRRILTATGPDDYVLAGDGWLEIHRHDAPAQRVPVPGFGTTWQESADSSVAVAVTAAAGHGEARWFAAWQPDGVTVRIPGASTCVAPHGHQAMLIGQPPALLDRHGRVRPVSDLDHAGACAWAATDVIVAEYAVGADGLTTRLRVLDVDGFVRWSRDVTGEAGVAADPTSSRVAYVVGDVLFELDRSVPSRTLNGVRSARYTVDGTLVLARQDATVSWLRR